MQEIISIPNSSLAEVERQELDQVVDLVLKRVENNRPLINKLVLDSVTAITTSSAHSRGLDEQSFVKRFLNNVTGKNGKIQSRINFNLSNAQYLSQQLMIKLAEQNLLTFDLLTTVNTKLNKMILDIDGEFNEIYQALVRFVRTIRSRLVEVDQRLDKVERNLSLLQWNTTIEYKMYDGKEYPDLDPFTKIICIANDFYHQTSGDYSTDDLMILKSTLKEVDIDIREKISTKEFYEYIIAQPQLIDRLFYDIDLKGLEKIEPYEAPLIKGVEKYKAITSSEAYVYETIASQMKKLNLPIEKDKILLSIVEEYLSQTTDTDLDKETNLFDFVMEILVYLDMINKADELEFVITEDDLKSYSEAAIDASQNEGNQESPYSDERIVEEYSQEGDVFPVKVLDHMPSLKWFLDFDAIYKDSIISPPVVSNGVVYIVTCEHLFAIDLQTRREIWKVGFDWGRHVSSLNLWEEKAFVGSSRGLFAFDAKAGGKLWGIEHDIAVGIHLDPLVYKDTIYYAVSTGSYNIENNNVFAIDCNTGQVKWENRVIHKGSLQDYVFKVSPTIGDNSVYFVGSSYLGQSEESYIAAYNLVTGEQQWASYLPDSIEVKPTYKDGKIYFKGSSNIYIVDSSTGDELFAWPVRNSFRFNSVEVKGTTVIYEDNNIFKARDINSGKVKWSFEVIQVDEDGYEESLRICPSPIIAGNALYFGMSDTDDNSYLYAIDIETGKEKWKYTITEKDKDNYALSLSRPPLIAEQMLIYVMEDRKLYVLE